MLCFTQLTVVEACFSIYILRVLLMRTKSVFFMFYYNARKQNCIYIDIFMRLSSCCYYFARPTRYFFFSIIVLHKEIRIIKNSPSKLRMLVWKWKLLVISLSIISLVVIQFRLTSHFWHFQVPMLLQWITQSNVSHYWHFEVPMRLQ